MKITNRMGLSQSWVRAAENAFKDYDKAGWRSASQMPEPPRKIILEERHYDEIETDVVDLMHLLDGSAMHYMLEHASEPGVLTEQRVVVEIPGLDGLTISCKADRLEPIGNGTFHLKDYKRTKVWAFIYGAKFAWEAQDNIYKWAYHKALGMDVTALTNELWLKDWSENEKDRDPRYPEAPIIPIHIEVWPLEKTEAYIVERARMFADCEKLKDDELPWCSESERWADPPKWAYQKKLEYRGKTGRAIRLCDTMLEAQAMLDKKKGAKDEHKYEVQFRPGASKRCEKHCLARPFCSQYQEMIEEGEPDF